MNAETKIGGIAVPLLAQACSKWTQSKNEAAGKVSSEASGVGEEDRIVSEVERRAQGQCNNDHEDEEKERLKTIAQLSEFLQEDTTIVAYPEDGRAALNLTRALTNLQHKVAEANKKHAAKKAPAPSLRSAFWRKEEGGEG